MDPNPALDLETDPRFPSGRWIGFFLDKRLPGKHQMELLLTFRQGEVTGEGRDKVGKFLVRGRYGVLPKLPATPQSGSLACWRRASAPSPAA